VIEININSSPCSTCCRIGDDNDTIVICGSSGLLLFVGQISCTTVSYVPPSIEQGTAVPYCCVRFIRRWFDTVTLEIMSHIRVP